MPRPGQVTFSRVHLERDLRAAGVEAGDVLVVHSSLGRIGWIMGGPREMIAALQGVLGEAGTLVMPTFSFNLDGWDLPPFDPWSTASRVGRLTEVFRRMPGVSRSHHPTHSVAAWGRLAADLTGGPIDYEPLGKGSPLDRARLAGAKILLAGVGQDRNSTVHLAESLAEMPYLRVPFTLDRDYDQAWYVEEKGRQARRLVIHETPGSSEGFHVLDRRLVEMGVSRPARIGQADSTIMKSQDLCDAVVSMLNENPLTFLNVKSGSAITERRREFMLREAQRRPVSG